MRPDDRSREDFDDQLGILFAGLDRKLTDERKQAYWQGLKGMSVLSFARIVEHCLSENGPKGERDFPTVPKVWGMYRAMRKPMAASVPVTRESSRTFTQPQPLPRAEYIRGRVNVALVRFIASREEVVTDPELHALRAEADRLKADYVAIDGEDKVTDMEIFAQSEQTFKRALQRARAR